MKQEIIDSYRTAFEELKRMFDSIEEEVKNEATKDVSSFMFQNRFDESQAAVVHLKTLLSNIKFDIDFNEIENSIQEYNANMEILRTHSGPIAIPSLTPEETKQVSSSEVFNNNFEKKQQYSKNEGFLEFIQRQLTNHKFNIVKTESNNIELEKNKKHYYMTLVKSNLQKEEYVSILEKMNSKKNIGFICENETILKSAKQITEEWAKSSPEYKIKFLSIHFTTKNRLEQNDNNAFETFTY